MPWADLPFVPYQPSPLPAAPTVRAPRCTLLDLTRSAPEFAGAMGNDGLVFRFVNHSNRVCLTDGYPQAVLSQPGYPPVSARPGGFWDMQESPADLPPGAAAAFIVGFATSCTGGVLSPVYEHVTVTMPGGGSFTDTLTSAGIPEGMRGVPVVCGVTVARFAASPPEPAYSVDPLLALTATINVPATVTAGSPIDYMVTLHNPTPSAIALSPCRGYFQLVDESKQPAGFQELNCAAAHPVPGQGEERFLMRLMRYSAGPGDHRLCWTLDVGPAQPRGAQACGTFRVLT